MNTIYNLWCHIDKPNNDQWYIAKYFFDYVNSEKGEYISKYTRNYLIPMNIG